MYNHELKGLGDISLFFNESTISVSHILNAFYLENLFFLFLSCQEDVFRDLSIRHWKVNIREQIEGLHIFDCNIIRK